jgi:hypothetical protein
MIRTTATLGALTIVSLLLPIDGTAQKSDSESKQVTASMSASQWIVRAGQRITLILELEVKPNVHVYAAGAQGYLPIEWKMKESNMGTFDAPVYPKPETLFLSAINEKVPVHENRVRLTREFTILPPDKVKMTDSGQFSIEGTLHYQACDDKMCYFPRELPVKWTLRFDASEEKRPDN